MAGRVHALDGLRGLAAVVVVVHHCLLTFPTLSAAYIPDSVPVGSSGWLVYSPIHLFWAGGEAVWLFFVLSGFVLTLPALRPNGFSWLAYYPSRLVRLYLPVLASIALALALATLVPRTTDGASGGWELVHSDPISVLSVTKEALLIADTNTLNTPLWSLRWEVLFSLALPLYVWFAVATRRWWWAVLAACLLSELAVGLLGFSALRYPPMFMVGCVMAVAAGQLGRLADRIARSGPWVWWCLATVAALGTTFYWTTHPASSPALALIAPTIVLSSVALVVFLASHWPAFGRLLRARPLQTLGTLSFSLYLVHEPIVVSLGFLLPAHLNVLTLVLGIPLSLAAATLFYRWVEAPTHRLSQRIRRSLADRGDRTGSTSPQIAYASVPGPADSAERSPTPSR